MGSGNSGPPPPPSPPPQSALHHDDADEEDDSVKQLGDCSTIYLALQNCLIKTDRNWKSCQADLLSPPSQICLYAKNMFGCESDMKVSIPLDNKQDVWLAKSGAQDQFVLDCDYQDASSSHLQPD